jgi:hypothetical protein
MLGRLFVLSLLRTQYDHFTYDISVSSLESHFKYVCVCVCVCVCVNLSIDPLLNEDRIENRSPKSSIVACPAIGADHAENIAFQPVTWRAGHFPATAVVALIVSRSFPSNGSIRHNI